MLQNSTARQQTTRFTVDLETAAVSKHSDCLTNRGFVIKCRSLFKANITINVGMENDCDRYSVHEFTSL